MIETIRTMLVAGLGGFVGTCCRFLVNRWSSGVWYGSFPMGTFLVNIIGCFIFGLIFGLIERTHAMSSTENALFITGICGGFTTFSAFAGDIWALINKGDWTTVALYLALSVGIGVLLVWAGRSLVR